MLSVGAGAPLLPLCNDSFPLSTIAAASALVSPREPCYEYLTLERHNTGEWGCTLNTRTGEVLLVKPFSAAALSGLRSGDRLVSLRDAEGMGCVGGGCREWGLYESDVPVSAESSVPDVMAALARNPLRLRGLVVREPMWAGVYESEHGSVAIKKAKLYHVRFAYRNMAARMVGAAGFPEQPCPQGGGPPPPGFSRLDGGLCGDGLYMRWVADSLEVCFTSTTEPICTKRFFAERLHPEHHLNLNPQKDGTYQLATTLKSSSTQLDATIATMHNVLIYVGANYHGCTLCKQINEVAAAVARNLKLSKTGSVSVIRIDTDMAVKSARLRRFEATLKFTFIFMKWGRGTVYRGDMSTGKVTEWATSLRGNRCVTDAALPVRNSALSVTLNLHSLTPYQKLVVQPRAIRLLERVSDASCRVLDEGSPDSPGLFVIQKNYTFDKGVHSLQAVEVQAAESYDAALQIVRRLERFARVHTPEAVVRWLPQHEWKRTPRVTFYEGTSAGGPLETAFISFASALRLAMDERQEYMNRGEVEDGQCFAEEENIRAADRRMKTFLANVVDPATEEGRMHMSENGLAFHESGRIVLCDNIRRGPVVFDEAEWCSGECTADDILRFTQAYSAYQIQHRPQSGRMHDERSVVGLTHSAATRRAEASLIMYTSTITQFRVLEPSLHAVHKALLSALPALNMSVHHMVLSENDCDDAALKQIAAVDSRTDAIFVVSDVRQEAAGVFRRTRTLLRNMSVWESTLRTGNVVYTDVSGRWVFGDYSTLPQDSGWVCSERPHNGCEPWEVPKWDFWDGDSAGWRGSAKIKVFDAVPSLRLWKGGVLQVQCPVPVLTKASSSSTGSPSARPNPASVKDTVRCILRGVAG